MTHTDIAFIKAYRSGNTSPHPAVSTPTGSPVPAPVGYALDDATPQMVCVDASALVANALVGMIDTTYVGLESINSDAMQTSVVQPRVVQNLKTTEQPALATFVVEPIKKTTVGSPRMPLSSFTSEPKENHESQVAFTWPTACDQLVQSMGDQWGPLVDLAEKQSDAGQTMLSLAGDQSELGCTTTVLALARELANRGKNVAIIDANTTNPTIAKSLGLNPCCYWQDVLENGVSVGEAMIHSRSERVAILPLEKVLAGADRLFECLQTAVTAGVLRYEFDIVLVDLGTLDSAERLEVATSLTRAMRIDHAIVIGNTNHAETDQQIEQIGLTLETADCQVLGLIHSGE